MVTDSVKSSMAARPCSCGPQPDALMPPNSTIAAESPYTTAFARAGTSSSVSKRGSEAPGPNVSLRAGGAWSLTSSKSIEHGHGLGGVSRRDAPLPDHPVDDHVLEAVQGFLEAVAEAAA